MKSAILEVGLTADEKEYCRLLLLKAMDSSLPSDSPGLSLMALITMRQNHRAKFDEISQAAGWGALICPKTTEPGAAPTTTGEGKEVSNG